ncbi:MAG: DnaB-like helicase C-terminal domain-containing protein [Thomasclavelia ramosa]
MENISGVKSGFRDLNKVTVSGFQKGDTNYFGCTSSNEGKPTFALNLAHNAAYKAEEPVAIFSLEMPAEQLVSEGYLLRWGKE